MRETPKHALTITNSISNLHYISKRTFKLHQQFPNCKQEARGFKLQITSKYLSHWAVYCDPLVSPKTPFLLPYLHCLHVLFNVTTFVLPLINIGLTTRERGPDQCGLRYPYQSGFAQEFLHCVSSCVCSRMWKQQYLARKCTYAQVTNARE